MKTINDLIIKLDKTIGHRFENTNGINEWFEYFLGIDIRFQDATCDTSTNDYRIIANLILDDGTDLYIDLYYLITRTGRLYITEYCIDGENVLDDYTKRIVK